MLEFFIEKIYDIAQNPVLWVVVVYFILFAILTLCKFWDGLFEEGFSYIKNIIFFYLFAGIISKLYNGVFWQYCNYYGKGTCSEYHYKFA